MFKKGESVVYPHHGAGTIEDVIKKTVLDEERDYYIFKQTIGGMLISLPVDNVTEVGLRSVISQNKARQIFKVLSGKCNSLPNDWNQRFKVNYEKISSGDTFGIAEVVRDLSSRDGLSTREKRMLTKAKKILTSELMHSLSTDEKKITKKIDELLN